MIMSCKSTLCFDNIASVKKPIFVGKTVIWSQDESDLLGPNQTDINI